MNIDVSSVETVASAECIACSACISECPSQKTKTKIYMTFLSIKMTPLAFAIVTFCVFFGSIYALDSAGLMHVTLPNIQNVQESGAFIKTVDLRGSMTIREGAVYVGRTLPDFYELMEIPETVPEETLLKDVSKYVPGYDFHAVKARK
jgi:ferredoxin